MIDQITPIILTFNEAPNIARTLKALSWSRAIIVVDSFSNDDTASIVCEHPNVRLFQRKFDSHGGQWTFALTQTGIATQWILALDADYVLSDELQKEIAALDPPSDVAGYQAPFRYCVQGKALRAAVYPPVTVLYRKNLAQYVQDGHTQRVRVDGRTLKLQNPIFHDDRKSLQRWFASQDRYMQLEADKLRELAFRDMSFSDRVRRLIVVAPIAMFLYCLFIRGNILDGKAGLFYAMQRSIAEAILSLHLLQGLLAGDSSKPR